MDDFLPPPGFTTVRYDSNTIQLESARKALEKVVSEDLDYRKVAHSHDISELLKIESHPHIPGVLLIPVLKLKEVNPCSNEIIVDRSCGMAVLRGAHVFAPGIIATPPSLNIGDKVAVYADLRNTCTNGSIAKFSGSKFFVGNGVSEVNRKQLFSSSCEKKANGVGIRMNEPIYLTPCLDQKKLPKSFFLQNLPSIVTGLVLAPDPHDIVLDMCSAPGGKATHICSLLHGTGHVIALDHSKSRIEKIIWNGERLGVSDKLHASVADSRYIIAEGCEKGKKICSFVPPFAKESFRRILLDAPCSALGQRPRLPGSEDSRKGSGPSFALLQSHLFKTAIALLSPGGVLVYSTCTVTYDENEGIVEWALKEFPELHLVKQVPHVGGPGRSFACSTLSSVQLELLQYFSIMPTERNCSHPADLNTIGFFIAKFEKR